MSTSSSRNVIRRAAPFGAAARTSLFSRAFSSRSDAIVSSGSRARPRLRRRHRLAQPGDFHAQRHDRAELARLDAGFRKQLLQPRHLGLQGEGVLRRAADCLRLLLGRLQLVPALVELPLQITRPGTGIYLCSSQLFAARFGRIRPRPFPLVPRTKVARSARQPRNLRRWPSPSDLLRQRRGRPNILVENRHAPDNSAWSESSPAPCRPALGEQIRRRYFKSPGRRSVTCTPGAAIPPPIRPFATVAPIPILHPRPAE